VAIEHSLEPDQGSGKSGREGSFPTCLPPTYIFHIFDIFHIFCVMVIFSFSRKFFQFHV